MEVWQLSELDVHMYNLRLFDVRLRNIEFFYHRFKQIRILICYKLIFIQYKLILGPGVA
jgi:hypothetical protein